MARQKPSRPTDAELAILNVLWRRAGISIREISLELKKSKPTTYATTQTLVRIMEKKGLVRRGEERYPALYYTTATEAAAKKHLIRDFAERAFDGSVKRLISSAIIAAGGSGTKKGGGSSQWNEIHRLVEQMPD
jgi:predicted transcriptional regulator